MSNMRKTSRVTGMSLRHIYRDLELTMNIIVRFWSSMDLYLTSALIRMFIEGASGGLGNPQNNLPGFIPAISA